MTFYSIIICYLPDFYTIFFSRIKKNEYKLKNDYDTVIFILSPLLRVILVSFLYVLVELYCIESF